MQVDNSNMNRYITYTFVYNENDQIIEEGEMCGSLLDYLYRAFLLLCERVVNDDIISLLC